MNENSNITKDNFIVLSKKQEVNMDEQWFSYEDENHFWFEWRFKFFMKFCNINNIDFKKKLNVLDIGSGSGTLSKQIENNSNWIIDCIDMNKSSLNKNIRKKGLNYLYNISDKNEKFFEKYDILIIFDVIEHIYDVPKFLKSAKYHLKKGGLILINVPSISLLYSEYDRQMGHYRRYDKNILLSHLNISDFNVVDVRFWGVFLIPLLFLRKILIYLLRIKGKNIVNFGFKQRNYSFKFIMRILMKLDLLFYNSIIGSSIMLLGTK